MNTKREKPPKCRFCGSKHLMVDQSGPDGAWQARCSDCRKTFPYTGKVFFQGELMTCALCGKQKPSDPNVNSDWRVIELDGTPFHVCTDHFPPDGATSADFAAAYVSVITELAERLQS